MVMANAVTDEDDASVAEDTVEMGEANDESEDEAGTSRIKKTKVTEYYVSFVLKDKYFADNNASTEVDKEKLTKHVNKVLSCMLAKTSWGINKYKNFTGKFYGGQFILQKQKHNHGLKSMSKVTITTKIAKILHDHTGQYFTIPEFCKMEVNSAAHGASETEDDFDYSVLAKTLCKKKI